MQMRRLTVCRCTGPFLALNGKILIKRRLSVAGGPADGAIDQPDRQPLTDVVEKVGVESGGAWLPV
jgi:hypothetical protein